MQLANETITIYNYYSAGRKGIEATRTVVHGVSWYKTIKSGITQAGYETAEVHLIRIPITVAVEDGKEFIEPKFFFEPSFGTDRTKFWTIQAGGENASKVVRGVAVVPPDDMDLDTRLEKEYADAVNVIAWADNRRGDPRGQHWRIEAT